MLSGRMRQRGLEALVLIGLAQCCLRGAAGADQYDPFPAPTGAMTSRTHVEVPADRTRTTIGICEVVDLEVSAVDLDCNVTKGQLETDTLGTPQWSREGCGNVEADELNGWKAVLTAHASPGDVTVTFTANDSGAHGHNESFSTSKTFTVKAPDGESFVYDQEGDYGGGDPPGDDDCMGFDAYYQVTVQPTTVSFVNAALRENKPYQAWTWPDGTEDEWPAEQPMFEVNEDNTWVEGDECYHYWPSVSLLWNAQELEYEDKWLYFAFPQEYNDQNFDWECYLPDGEHIHVFREVDFKAQCIRSSSGTGGVESPWMGPWLRQ